MNFDDFDAQMRRYETARDYCVPPGMWIVARMDGRGFTGATAGLEKPFAEPFARCIADAARHLMTDTGLAAPVYAFAQSDEISLLLALDDPTFGRKERKLISILAAETALAFNRALSHTKEINTVWANGLPAFDARLSLLPNAALVVDYFRWRQADCARNALNSWCHWTLIQRDGATPRWAHSRLFGATKEQKHELLREYGVNFATLPAWQRNGIGLRRETYTKDGVDPRTGEDRPATRRRVAIERALPHGNEYGAYVAALLAESVREAEGVAAD